MNIAHDLAIIGGGPVGTALALLLVQSGSDPRRILVIDRQTREQAQADPRVIALAAGSMQILGRIANLASLASAPIETIHVSQVRFLGRTVLQAGEQGVRALGHVVRYGEIMRVLDDALAASAVQVRRPAHVSDTSETAVLAHWDDDQGGGRAHVLAHAEGGVFDASAANGEAKSVDPGQRDYQQTAIIGEIECDAPRNATAFERFGAHGPIALLPLPQRARYALVWCERPEIALQLMQLDPAEFLARLQQVFGNRLGRLTAVSERHAYPLGLVRRHDRSSQRIVRIGNAAQIMHPVAGQGLNLGLRDAFGLSSAIAESGYTSEAVARFLRNRRLDRALTITLTDSFARGFALPFAPLRHLAGLGLLTLDCHAGLRKQLAHQFMFGMRA